MSHRREPPKVRGDCAADFLAVLLSSAMTADLCRIRRRRRRVLAEMDQLLAQGRARDA